MSIVQIQTAHNDGSAFFLSELIFSFGDNKKVAVPTRSYLCSAFKADGTLSFNYMLDMESLSVYKYPDTSEVDNVVECPDPVFVHKFGDTTVIEVAVSGLINKADGTVTLNGIVVSHQGCEAVGVPVLDGWRMSAERVNINKRRK